MTDEAVKRAEKERDDYREAARAEVACYREELKRMTADRDAWAGRACGAAMDRDAAVKRMVVAEAECDKTRAYKSRISAELLRQLDEVDRAVAAMNEAIQRAERAEAALSEANDRIASRDEDITSLNECLERVGGQAEQAEAEAKRLCGENGRLREELAIASRLHESAASKTLDAGEEVERLRAALERLAKSSPLYHRAADLPADDPIRCAVEAIASTEDGVE